MTTWFNTFVYAAVLLILIVSAGQAVMGLGEFNPLAVAGSASMLLMLPVLYRLSGRRPKARRR